MGPTLSPWWGRKQRPPSASRRATAAQRSLPARLACGSSAALCACRGDSPPGPWHTVPLSHALGNFSKVSNRATRWAAALSDSSRHSVFSSASASPPPQPAMRLGSSRTARTHAHTHARTHARTARTHARTHAHARTHTRTHAHTRTHTQSHVYQLPRSMYQLPLSYPRPRRRGGVAMARWRMGSACSVELRAASSVRNSYLALRPLECLQPSTASLPLD